MAQNRTGFRSKGGLMQRSLLAVITTIGAISLIGATTAPAQDYPTRPLRFITGYLPGGVSDTIARVVGERLGERLGQRVVID
jgi:tripartite-type tricarboxylate transporter receptor subunit TctC